MPPILAAAIVRPHTLVQHHEALPADGAAVAAASVRPYTLAQPREALPAGGAAGPPESSAGGWRGTLAAVGAVPYLALAVARPLLAAVRPFCWLFTPPQAPGVPSPDAPERRLPPQRDWRQREARLTVRGDSPVGAPALHGAGSYRLYGQPGAGSNAAWLAQKPYRLVAGAGFVGIYQQLGRFRALDRMGLVPHDIVGYSSGAIAAAMVCCLGVNAAEPAMMGLSVADFLDPTLVGAWQRGGACTGLRLQAKLERTLAPAGTNRIEDMVPPLQVAVYDRKANETQLHAQGPLALRVRQSAALPLLFAMGRFIDGGWIDHHGRLAMRPGERALQSRLRASDGGAIARKLGRVGPIFSISDDPEHATLCVQPRRAVTKTNFVYVIDHDKLLLQRIVDESERLTLAWLAMPRAYGAAAEQGAYK